MKPAKPARPGKKKARWTAAEKAARRAARKGGQRVGGDQRAGEYRGRSDSPAKRGAVRRDDDRLDRRGGERADRRGGERADRRGGERAEWRSSDERAEQRGNRSGDARPGRGKREQRGDGEDRRFERGTRRPDSQRSRGEGRFPRRASRGASPRWPERAPRTAETRRGREYFWGSDPVDSAIDSARAVTPRPAGSEGVRSEGARSDVVRSEAGGLLGAFAYLGLPEPILTALARRGIRTPFPIQAAAIPDALAGRDLLGRGQTGSGKTMAFGLPLLTRLRGTRSAPGHPRALILVPTRELALQVADALEPIGRAVGVQQKVVAGGMPYPPQLAALERGVDVLIATPGRLQDLIDRGAARLDAVEIVVLDEADHMADLGFLPEVTAILDLVPAGGQRLLFSATLDSGIADLADRYLVDPVTHSTDDPTAAVSTMEHRVLLIEPSMKKSITAEISGRPGKTLIFVRTQLGADRVAKQLRESGILAGPIHAGLPQGQRTATMAAFKEGRLDVLVATDVAARGIHVDDVSLVVQVDPPNDHKTYVHRSGRTARAGSTGSVVTLALPHQRKGMERIIDEVALAIRPEHYAGSPDTPTREPIPEAVWQAIVAPRRPRREGTRREGPRHKGPRHKGDRHKGDREPRRRGLRRRDARPGAARNEHSNDQWRRDTRS